MKQKIIFDWLLCSAIAVCMYGLSLLLDSNGADLIFAVGCVAYGIPLVGILITTLLFCGIDKNSVYQNFVFSWLLLAATPTIQYAIIYRLMENSLLYYSISTALLFGLFFIWLGEKVRVLLYNN